LPSQPLANVNPQRSVVDEYPNLPLNIRSNPDMGLVVRLACLLRAKRWARRLRAAHQVEQCLLKLEAFQRELAAFQQELAAADVGMAEADRGMEVVLRLAYERGMPDDSLPVVEFPPAIPYNFCYRGGADSELEVSTDSQGSSESVSSGPSQAEL
jgi:hypothetical protein